MWNEPCDEMLNKKQTTTSNTSKILSDEVPIPGINAPRTWKPSQYKDTVLSV